MNVNMIVASGLTGVSFAVTPDAHAVRDAILAEARDVTAIKGELGQTVAVDTLKKLRGMLKDLEETRKKVKAPVLEIGRRIDKIADVFSEDIQKESERITHLLTAYETEQRRIAAEAEAKRRADEEAKLAAARKAEAERLAAEREAQRQLDEAARQAREAANTEQRAAAQAAAAAAQAEADRIAAERQKAEMQAKIEAAQAMTPVAAPQRVAGQVVQEVWTYDVVNVRALAAAYPDLVVITPKRADILALIRDGTREIPGLAIRKEVKVGVRA